MISKKEMICLISLPSVSVWVTDSKSNPSEEDPKPERLTVSLVSAAYRHYIKYRTGFHSRFRL